MACRKIMTVVGARPQFVKAAVVSHAMRQSGDMDEIIIHTGQHFDYGMSQAFFDELSIPEPQVNLGVSGGSHAQMTARMMIELERVIEEIQPDMVLLFGDTNSTLAACLAAAKMHVAITHVEAGTRTRSLTNPEEINRVCCDHISSLLLACTRDNYENLVFEGLGERSRLVGDPMYDAFCTYMERARIPQLTMMSTQQVCEPPQEFYYLTCHREENTKDPDTLKEILNAMQQLDAPVVYPVHPRNKAAVGVLLENNEYSNVRACAPVGYLESIWLVTHAKQVITDSGGLQREAFFAGVKCTTILDFEVWPETMVGNRNLLVRPNCKMILAALRRDQIIDKSYQPFGDGCSAKLIVREMESFLGLEG